jgi:hypothetical protein
MPDEKLNSAVHRGFDEPLTAKARKSKPARAEAINA